MFFNKKDDIYFVREELYAVVVKRKMRKAKGMNRLENMRAKKFTFPESNR